MRGTPLPALVLLLAGVAASARPLAPEEVPEPLRPWIGWVLHADDTRTCPMTPSDPDDRACAFAGSLALELDDAGGTFRADWRTYGAAWLLLPGDARRWPQDVRLNGDNATVLERDGRPALRVEAGTWTIEGRYAWERLPESLPVPPETGLVRARVNGAELPPPDIGAGELWLKRRDAGAAPQGEADTVALQVFRRLGDDIPIVIETLLDLQVAGRAREALIGPVLLADTVAIQVDSALPAQLQPDGRLRLQLRPGHWQVRLHARTTADRTQFAPVAAEAPWPAEEIWAFDARTAIRLAEVTGAVAVDPRQTSLPPQWQALPAYRLQPGETLALDVVRRGDPEPEPDRLELDRHLYLDFDGGGYTVRDALNGAMTRGWRLEAGERLELGAVRMNGDPQLVTAQPGSGRRGVEVRRGALALEADSRHAGSVRALPAVGWNHDVQRLATTLHLPPGWTLLAARGIDKAEQTWIGRWTLLDLFLVLIAALAVGRLWRPAHGALALAALALIWHEPAAPRTVWLHVLAAIALLRVLPGNPFRTAVTVYRNVALLALVGIAVPFAIDTVRTGLYPQLEQPWLSLGGEQRADASVSMEYAAQGAAAPMELREQALAGAMPAPAAPASDAVSGYDSGAPAKSLPARVARKAMRAYAAVDPNANLQTGPGVPQWRWHEVQLTWNGPVERDQQMVLMLLSPGVNLLLDVLRVALVLALAVVMLRTLAGTRLPSLAGGASTVLAGLLATGLAFAPGETRAAMPTPELLQELRARLTAPPDCAPQCAQMGRMRIEITGSVLMLRLDIVAGADVQVPLPADAKQWLPEEVSVDGAAGQDRLRRVGEQLWIALGAGARQVILLGRLPPRASFELPLPLIPHRVELLAEGWTVDGVREDGTVEGQLRLSRNADSGAAAIAAGAADPAAAAPPLPPFVRVERTLRLGLDWTVDTSVSRDGLSSSAPVVIEVPLLPGEAVTTPGFDVVDGRVRVNMPPDAAALAWTGTLAKGEALALVAPEGTAWTETWRLEVAPMWHVESQGIAVVHHQNPEGAWAPEWRPWPGERVELAITRPEGVAGPTLTIDSSRLQQRPGRRATDVELQLSLRSSQGGQHTLTLPEGAELQTAAIDGVAQPVRQEGRAVTLPVRPGTQAITLAWRESRGIGTYYATSAVDLGAASVNSRIDLALGEDRWVLFTGGPRLGPAVLYWGTLIVIALVAAGLARVPLTPLRTPAWLLLGVGLSQVDIWSALLVVGWLLLLGWRGRYDANTRRDVLNLTQLALAVLTLGAAGILFAAIRQGLLGAPDMQIAGNGSSAWALAWYQDRVAGTLPQGWVISVPLMVYRLLMLAWALWLAFSLLRWLRWGWTCMTAGGLWRPGPPRARPAVPVPDGEPPAAA